MKLFIAIWFLGCVGSLIGCRTIHYPKVIVYDEAWSSHTALPNLNCIPSDGTHNVRYHREREAEAKADFDKFSGDLLTALKTTQRCQGLEVLTDAGSWNNSEGSKQRLAQLDRGAYWRLRVNFRPRVESQAIDLREFGAQASSTELSAEYSLSNVDDLCKYAREGPAPIYW